MYKRQGIRPWVKSLCLEIANLHRNKTLGKIIIACNRESRADFGGCGADFEGLGLILEVLGLILEVLGLMLEVLCLIFEVLRHIFFARFSRKSSFSRFSSFFINYS